MGAVFLELFLKMLEEKFEEKDFKPIAGFDCENATAKVEKYIGVISENKEEGGRIDIIITDKMKNAIIIENKIYAADGEKQLLRYNNFGAANHKDQYILLYLTLYGTPASNQSTGKIKENPDAEVENIEKEEETLSKEGLDTIENIKKESNINVINISYEKDILAWLEKCKEKAVNHPMLRESIAQYINLIKYLTKQTINKKMEDEIKELLKNDPNLIKPLWASYCALIKLNKEFADKLIEDLNKSLQKFKINVDKRNDIEIEPKLVNDNDGFHLCFYEGSRKFTQINEVFPEDVVKRIKNSFETNGSPLCWEKLKVFDGQNLHKISAEDFAKLLQNTGHYKEEIIKNVNEIINEFKTLIKV